MIRHHFFWAPDGLRPRLGLGPALTEEAAVEVLAVTGDASVEVLPAALLTEDCVEVLAEALSGDGSVKALTVAIGAPLEVLSEEALLGDGAVEVLAEGNAVEVLTGEDDAP